ncbi:MAG: hypothetical protein ACKV2Q_36525 [Planctomycetaceae bacterium]
MDQRLVCKVCRYESGNKTFATIHAATHAIAGVEPQYQIEQCWTDVKERELFRALLHQHLCAVLGCATNALSKSMSAAVAAIIPRDTLFMPASPMRRFIEEAGPGRINVGLGGQRKQRIAMQVMDCLTLFSMYRAVEGENHLKPLSKQPRVFPGRNARQSVPTA